MRYLPFDRISKPLQGREMTALAVVVAVVVFGLGLAGACVLAWELDAMYDEGKRR